MLCSMHYVNVMCVCVGSHRDRTVPYGFHNSLKVLNFVSPLTSQPVNPSSLPLCTHTHYQPPLPKTHNSFSSTYPLPSTLHPLLSLFRKPTLQSQESLGRIRYRRVSQSEIHQIHCGLYLTLLDTAEGQVA